VVAGDEEISPALDFEALEYCPRHEYEGRLGSEVDGFLYAIDESVIQAAPGSIITIRGPGHAGVDLRAGLAVIDVRIDAALGRVWHLQASAEVGRSQVGLYLDWDEGKAHYAFIVDAIDGADVDLDGR